MFFCFFLSQNIVLVEHPWWKEDNIRKIPDISTRKIPDTRFWNPNRTADAGGCVHRSEFVYKLGVFVRRGSVKGAASGAGALVPRRGGRLPSQSFSTVTTRELKFERVELLPKPESRNTKSYSWQTVCIINFALVGGVVQSD